MTQGTVHIVGAGLAGLSAATALAGAGRRVALYEAAGQAGGRCRSYEDSVFGGMIDNGNHLLLSGNRAALAYVRRIGSADAFASEQQAEFPFVDAATMQRWRLRLSRGRFPWWLLDKTRRVPDTRPADYLPILRLLRAGPQQTAAQLLDPHTTLFQRLWQPLLVSALNTHPQKASAQLAGAILRGTLLQGGAACIPLVAQHLSAVFIDPALRYLMERDVSVQFNRRLRQIEFSGDAAAILHFAEGEPVALGPHDKLICAVPPWVAGSLLPGLQTPDDFRPILNAHFRINPPAQLPRITGVVNATAEWIFAFPGRISVTISDAGRLMQEEREALAQRLWQEVASIAGLASDLPPWQIVKEKRATFAATPQQNAKRPGVRTTWRNVLLAGDWLQTGLPATIESAVLSGETAAQAIMRIE